MKSELSQPRAISALLSACLEDNAESAWREFVSRFQPLIASVIVRIVRRYGQTDYALADDLVQETFLRLCKRERRALQQFQERHESAFFGYLKVIAASVATDYFRSINAQKRQGDKPGVTEELADSVASQPSYAEERIMMQEIDSFLDRSSDSSRDKAIFWLYYRHGFTARDIAKLPEIGLSDKGVESCIFRLTRAVRELASQQGPSRVKRGEGEMPSATLGGMG